MCDELYECLNCHEVTRRESEYKPRCARRLDGHSDLLGLEIVTFHILDKHIVLGGISEVLIKSS